MKNKTFSEYLNEIGACQEARAWVDWNYPKGTDRLWQECERGDWMGWFLVKAHFKLGITKQQITLALCDCAMLSLKYFEDAYPDDNRPRQAIAVAKKWAKGKATREEALAAAQAAKDASYCALDVPSAEYAAYAACVLFQVVDDTGYAIYLTNYVATAAEYAVNLLERTKVAKKQADILRKHFPELNL